MKKTGKEIYNELGTLKATISTRIKQPDYPPKRGKHASKTLQELTQELKKLQEQKYELIQDEPTDAPSPEESEIPIHPELNPETPFEKFVRTVDGWDEQEINYGITDLANLARELRTPMPQFKVIEVKNEKEEVTGHRTVLDFGDSS